MKLSDKNDTLFGNHYLISDSGMTILVKLKDGTIGAEGFSRMLYRPSHAEDLDMREKPEEMWEKFFQQSTLDDV